MNKLTATRVPSIITLAVLTGALLQGCAMGNSDTSFSQGASSVSYQAEAEEKNLLREDAQKTKAENAKKSSEAVAPPAPAEAPKVEDPPAVATAPIEQAPAAPIAEPVVEVAVPVAPEPVIAPAPAPAPVAPAPAYVEPVVAAPPLPTARAIYVGLSGGQETVDMCQGPVLFTTAGLPYPYIAEHEQCGGWGRIGTLGIGSRVSLSGLVGGEYSVGQIISVNKFATTDALIFASTPRAILQTCIPGTNQMLVYALY